MIHSLLIRGQLKHIVGVQFSMCGTPAVIAMRARLGHSEPWYFQAVFHPAPPRLNHHEQS
jgi:uncharacterized membrane protein YadS